MRGIIGRFYKETCGDGSHQTATADGDADVCWLCLLTVDQGCHGERRAPNETELGVVERLGSYHTGGKTPPYQGW